MELNENMKDMLRQLGEAINDSISRSGEINETIGRIKEEGYEIFLVLEATIGLNATSDEESGASAGEISPTAGRLEGKAEDRAGEGRTNRRDKAVVFRINPDDKQFLRSLRISVDDLDEKSGKKR